MVNTANIMRSQLVQVLIVAFASQLVALPTESDSRRLPSLKCNFRVRLKDPLGEAEKLAISGDTKALGKWSPNAVVFLVETASENIYSGKVQCAANTVVNYRYLVGVVGENGDLQIRKWETHVEGRTLKVGTVDITTSDHFGVVNGETKIHPGWLHSGYILELKLFRNPIQLNVDAGQRTYVKITALDYENNNRPIPSSARADIQVVRMETGSSNFRAQGTYGAPYDRDDIVIFHITTNDLDSVLYEVAVFKTDGGEDTTELGSQIIFPNVIRDSKGQIELELISPDDESVIGTILLGYVLIKPMSAEYKYDFRTSFIQYWRKDWNKLVAGHRGLGYSLEVSENAAPVIENTVASMLATGRLGADIVEFDIHVTSDLIPIIFHNFVLPVAKDPYVEPTSAADIKLVSIKDLTYDEIKNINIYEVVNSKVVKYKSYNEEPRKNWRLFPSLEDFFDLVPLSVGMDLDIKWPQEKSNGQLESIQTIDKNVFVDAILDVVYRKGCGRMLYFSGQDLDVSTMINYKQNMHPIMPLGQSSNNYYYDPRTENYERVINNAIAYSLLGVVPHSFNFDLAGIRAINKARDQNLQVCIWGDDLSKSSSKFEYYLSLKPTCVIPDRLYLLLSEGRKSIFSQGDLPGFFQKQCSK